ncbi:unnamed protein product, partial [Aphanomyces euteiches]
MSTLRGVAAHIHEFKSEFEKLRQYQELQTKAFSDAVDKSIAQHNQAMSIMGELKAQTLQNSKDLSFVVDHLGKLTQSHHQLGERVVQMGKSNEELQVQMVEMAEQINYLQTRLNNGDVDAANQGVNPNQHASEYPEWDIFGIKPAKIRQFTPTELDDQITRCHKQKSFPMYSGNDSDDIEIFALKMVVYYGAFDLSFYNAQIDERVGQLMHNHLEKKAIAWLMKEYDGPRKYSVLIRRMRARFVTKSKEDMTIENFIDPSQGKKTLDQYIEQFKVLSNGEEFSDNFLQIKFKKGLSSQTLKMLLKTRSYATLESLIDDARTLNATDTKETS